MPKIPLYEQKVGPEEHPLGSNIGTPEAEMHTFSKPLLQAFGTDIAEANERLGKVVAGLGDKMAEHAIELQKRSSEQKAFQVDNADAIETQEILHGKVGKDGKVEGGLLNRELDSAAGITEEYDKLYKERLNKALSEASGPYSEQLIRKMYEQRHESVRNNLITHEAREGQKAYNVAVEANLNNRINEATNYLTPEELINGMNQVGVIKSESLNRNGIKDAGVIEYAGKEVKGKMALASIGAMLNTDTKQARIMFDAVKDNIDEDSAAKINTAIKGKEFLDVEDGIYAQVKGFKLATGESNFAAAEKHIEQLPLTTEEKREAKKYVISRLREDDTNLTRYREGVNEKFMNDLYSAKKNGVPLKDALSLATKYGHDPYDKGLKAEVVRKLYTESGTSKSDPHVYMNLWEGVQQGITKKEDIEKALTDGSINTGDYEGLRKEWFNNNIKGSPKDIKVAYKNADSVIDSNTQKGTEVKFDGVKYNEREWLKTILRQNTAGKSAEEITTYAAKLVSDKGQRKSGDIWSAATKKEMVKGYVEDTLTVAGIKESLGEEVALAVGGGDINKSMEFINKNGGIIEFTQGHPKYNAVRALVRDGVPVTEVTLNYILNKYKDGLVPGDVTLK